MEQRKKVVKFKQRRSINIGVIIFIIMFLYIGANVFLFFTKERLSIYEVQAGTTAEDTVASGVIIRDEEVVSTNTAGYISYFQKEGERVSKKSTLYTIDENKKVYELMTNNTETELTDDDFKTIQKEVLKYTKIYSDSNFSSVVDFKYDMENIVTEVMLERTMDSLQDMIRKNGIDANFNVVKAPNSGIVTYHFDNLEKLKEKDVTKETFNQETYKKTQLRSSDIIAAKQPVCKIVKSENWKIVTMLSENQYSRLQDKKLVNITILNDGRELKVPITTFTSGDEFFATLNLSSYMINYLDERFLEIEFRLNEADGLKIPKSALVEKDFYVIPLNMFNQGADSKERVLTTVTYDTNGDFKTNTVIPKIYYEDEESAYVSVNLFEYGTKIKSTETQDVLQLTTTSTLQGVYNVNNGYFIFEKVKILYENQDYYIVEENVKNSVSRYDQIALDASKVTEETIIY